MTDDAHPEHHEYFQDRTTAMTKHSFIAILIGVAGVLTVGGDALAVYHPTLGRFIQRDPLGYVDGMNLHEYLRSTPSVRLDPTGELSFSEIEVDEELSQKHADHSGVAPVEHNFRARFSLAASKCQINVTIKLRLDVYRGNIRNAKGPSYDIDRGIDQLKSRAINGTTAVWDNKYKICPDCDDSCSNGYAIRVQLKFVDSNWHHRIRVKPTRRSRMTEWDIDIQPRQVAHEVGHMLGNRDEYGVVDGRDYNLNPATPSVMSSTSLASTLSTHYLLIQYYFLQEAIKKTRKSEIRATVVGIGEPCSK